MWQLVLMLMHLWPHMLLQTLLQGELLGCSGLPVLSRAVMYRHSDLWWRLRRATAAAASKTCKQHRQEQLLTQHHVWQGGYRRQMLWH